MNKLLEPDSSGADGDACTTFLFAFKYIRLQVYNMLQTRRKLLLQIYDLAVTLFDGYKDDSI